MDVKQCSRCNEEKCLSDFYKYSGRKSHYPYCKKCHKQVSKEWSHANPGKNNGYTRKSRYGIDQQQFDEMLASQGNRCAICGTSEPGGKRGFNVDHCHTTGKVRALLCHHCNSGLGHFRDDTSLLGKAQSYLISHGHS